MNENFSNIGVRISEKMDELDLKQVDICRITGISKNAISNYVNGNRVPDTMAVYKLSKALKVSIEWILTGEEAISPEKDISKSELISMTSDEVDMITKFRELDYEDQQDAMDIIDMKYNRKVKKGTSSSLTNGGGAGEGAATDETA